MGISDKKKCQTLINKAAEAAEQIRAAVTMLKAICTAYQSQNVYPTGTPLDGKVAAVSGWIDDADSVASSAVATQMIAAVVPSHRGQALEI